MSKDTIRTILVGLLTLPLLLACEPTTEEPEKKGNGLGDLVDIDIPKDTYSQEELAKANTAKGVDIADDEKKVILYINLVRLDGKRFWDTFVTPYLNGSSNDYTVSLKADLEGTKELSMMEHDSQLHAAATYHAEDMGKNGTVSHNSSDGTSFANRIRRYYSGSSIAENCSYGLSDPLEIVIDLLIDEGTSSLGHRKNILNSEYKAIGVAIQPHAKYKYNCVQDFGSSLSNDNKDTDDNSNDDEKKDDGNDSFDPLSLYTTEEIEMANTAKNASVGDEERQMILYLNLARLGGKRFYDAFVEPYYIQKMLKGEPNSYTESLKTKLESLQGLKMLAFNKSLYASSTYHANDIGTSGGKSQDSSDGTSYDTRIKRFYDGLAVNEVCYFGTSDPLHIVLTLLVDDGLQFLSHRQVLLSDKYDEIGIALQPHTYYQTVCVMDLGQADPNAPEDPDDNQGDDNDNGTQDDDKPTDHFTDEEINQANTAKDADILENEKKVILYMNLARLDGKRFWDIYAAPNIPKETDHTISLKADLEAVCGLTMLAFQPELYASASYHAEDMGTTGNFSHDSSDGTNFGARIKRYYNSGYIGENCSGGNNDPLKIVLQLLIDENSETLGHRKNILDKWHRRTGVAIRPHIKLKYICVQDFSN